MVMIKLKKNLAKRPIQVGTFYMTSDTGEFFIDTPQGRMQLQSSPYNIDEEKENNYGESTIFKVEE